MKCASCGEKLQETFLSKIHGTHIKDAKGKLHVVCSNCQKEYTKEQLLEKL